MKTLLLLFSIVLVIACSREGTAPVVHMGSDVDSIFPVVEIMKPVTGQSYRYLDTIKVEGRASDIGLHAGTVKIINDADGAVLKQQSFDLHTQQAYNFSLTHVVQTTTAADYTVRAEFEDHSSNRTLKTVNIKVRP